ncbi:MAG: MopE-related protein [Myxococcota bacterium]
MRLVSHLALTAYAGSLVIALSGCGAFSFVSDKERQDLKDNLDDDNDGVPSSADCDDENPLRRPTGDPENPAHPWADPSWVEIPYDGIDNDCDEVDIVDVDGDGFPGISFADYAAMQMERLGLASPDDVPWPTNVDRLQTDCVDGSGSQVLPEGLSPADVNPAVLDDEPYDGVDRDCAGDNDFDDDGDGQMPPTVNGMPTGPLLDAYIQDWGIQGIDPSGANAFGDCNDNNDDVYTGAPGELPYDGIDQDCSGDNDFDQDGDGYYPEEYAIPFGNFVAAYHPEDLPDGPDSWGPTEGVSAQPGDCLDQPHPNLAAADPALVFPGASDAWYDGIDSDCLGDNDFDQDGDLYVRTEDTLALQDYVANWSGTQPDYPRTVNPLFEADGGDCDDTNPTVAPGNLEILGDANDADCDLSPDATPWGFGGYAWDTPTWPRMVRTDEHYVVGVTASWTSLFNRNNPALALLFTPTDAGYDAVEDEVLVWNNISPTTTFVHGSGLDVLADGPVMWFAVTYKTPSQTDTTRILLRQYAYDPILGYQYELANRVSTWFGYDVDLDLQLDTQDPGKLWLMACGGAGREDPNGGPENQPDPTKPPSFRSLTMETPVFTDPASQNVSLLTQTVVTNDASSCFQELAPDGMSSLQTVCDESGCESYTADISTTPGTVTLSTDTTWQNTQVREIDEHSGLILMANIAGGATIVDNLNGGATYDVFAGEQVLSVDGMWRNGVLYVAAVVEASPVNMVKLAYGNDPTVGLDQMVDLPVYDYDPTYQHTPVGSCDPLEPLCSTGRNLDPYKISLHADQDRLALGVAARSIDDATLPTNTLLMPLPQDAVGWLFMGYDPTVLP